MMYLFDNVERVHRHLDSAYSLRKHVLQTDPCTEGFVCATVLVCNTCVCLCGLPSPWQHLCWSGDRLQPAVRNETDRPAFEETFHAGATHFHSLTLLHVLK